MIVQLEGSIEKHIMGRGQSNIPREVWRGLNDAVYFHDLCTVIILLF
jgi:hypothetical protein